MPRLRLHLLLASLALFGAPLLAQASVTLAGPEGPQDSGWPIPLQATVTGAGPECAWMVLEHGVPVDAAEGVRLEPNEAGGMELSVDAGREPRTVQVRAASRLHPEAYAVATVQVRAGAARETKEAGAGPVETRSQDVSRIPEGDAKNDPPAQPRRETLRPPYAWQTPFSRQDRTRRFSTFAWDGRDPRDPAILATEFLERHERTRIVRIRMDGTEAVVTAGAGETPLGPEIRGLGILPGGDLVVTDPAHRRLARIDADGRVTTFAGSGQTDLAPRTGPGQERTPATQVRLGRPDGLAVAPDRTVVFADTEYDQLCQVTPDGRIEVIAGTGRRGIRLRLDPARPWPTTAMDADFLQGATARPVMAPDGRILCGMGRWVLVLHPDRSAQVLGSPRGPFLAALAVLDGGQVVAYSHCGRYLALRPGGGWAVMAGSAPSAPVWSSAFLNITTEPIIPASRFKGDMCQLAAVPGGGALVQSRTSPWFWHLGPLKGDEALAGLVKRAASGALGTDAKAVATAADDRDGLRRWALRKGAPWLGPVAKGRLGLPAGLTPTFTRFLVPEAGLALRARFALLALDRLVQRENPAAADLFAAWPLVPAGRARLMAPAAAEPAEPDPGDGAQRDPGEDGTPPVKRARVESKAISS